MKLAPNFDALVSARDRMGALERQWMSDAAGLLPREGIDFQLGAGLEIDIQEVDSFGQLHSYKGRHVVIYIKDHSKVHNYHDDPSIRRRVHLADCRTILEKKSNGSFDKYVATTRRDNLYSIYYSDNVTGRVKERDVELYPCKNCLKQLRYQGYGTRFAEKGSNAIVRDFDVNEFFEDYVAIFAARPRYTAGTAPLPGYVDTWCLISRNLRKSRGWKCESCGVNLESRPAALHTHHIDGMTRNNISSNLRALCAVCHKRQPGHSHMRVDSKIRKSIIDARAEQGLR